MQNRSSDLIVQQDTQEVPELPPEEETTIYSAEDEIQELHLVLAGRPRIMFPPDSLQIVRLMKGNTTCVDCQGYDEISGIMVEPMYASITHGTLLCRKCAVAHVHRDARAFGIKSFMEDRWNMNEVLALLEGGNDRFREFCAVTNSYPSLQGVDDHTQFIDGLYASVPVKAYRSLLRKSVGKVLEEHKGLIHNHHSHLRRQQRSQHRHDDTVCTTRPEDYKKYGKIVPMMSIYDYYTTVLKQEWPLSEQQIIDQLEDSALEELEASASALDETALPLKSEEDNTEAGMHAEQATKERRGEEAPNTESRPVIEEEKKDIDGNDFDEGFTKPDTSDLSVVGDDPSLFGEELVSLTGDEASVSNAIKPKAEEYEMPLKEENKSSSTRAGANMKRIQRPDGSSLPPVLESSPSTDTDSDSISLLSREEIQLSRYSQSNPRKYNMNNNDDCQSVASSVGSSVGDMDLKSIPDSQSVMSSDLESIAEVTKADAMLKHLEPSLPTQDSFRNLAAEPVDTTYAPQDAVELARNIHELEASNSKLEYDDEKDEILPTEDGDNQANERNVCTDKSVQFDGLPSTPPERTKDKPRGPIKRIQNEGDKDVEDLADGLLEDFQPRRNSSERNKQPYEDEPTETTSYGRPRLLLPQPTTNGRMGPNVVPSPGYTPQMRPSFRRLRGGGGGGSGGSTKTKLEAEKKQPRRLSSQRSPSPNRAPSPQQQLVAAASRVSSAYRNQVSNITRNFGRPLRNNNEIPQQHNDIPEYSGNLAAQATVDDLSPTRVVRSPSPHQDVNGNRNKLGSLIAKSRRTLVNNTDKLSNSFRRGSLEESHDGFHRK